MSNSLTLANLEARTGVPRVRLRYIADSEILPGNRVEKAAAPKRPGRGVARLFLPSEAFGMVIAIQLLNAGIRRATVSRIMDILGTCPPGVRDFNEVPLLQALVHAEVQWLEIGDGVNIHMVCDPPRIHSSLFQHWLQIDTGAKLSDYDPLVIVRINVRRLRELVR